MTASIYRIFLFHLLCFFVYPNVSGQNISSLNQDSTKSEYKNFNKIGIFYDSDSSQQTFAASSVQKAFEKHGYSVELKEIENLSRNYPFDKVVIALQSILDKGKFLDEVEKPISRQNEQSFAVRTIDDQSKSYWIVGGDANGAMYGGLQLAEYIDLYGVEKSFNEEQQPDMLKRGIKWNIPFDKRSPTYYGSKFSKNDFRGTSSKKAITHVWDLDFWSSMFDELAKHRYNAISLWSLHPFTSMVQMDEYPEAALQNVQGFDGYFKRMSIDDKIVFWKKVMTLAKDRGIEFYLYNWNIFTYGATGKYGIDNNPKNPQTIKYMRKCIAQLFATYPDLTGFGITAGENMKPLSNKEEADWTWATYGQGVSDFAKEHPNRKITFIHRYHDAGGPEVAESFKQLVDLPNVQFDFSFKYAVAHIYSAPKPEWILTRNGDVPAQLIDLNLKTWIELRNDSFYYLHWGNPDFVKEYLDGFPEKEKTFRGFFMGSDGITPTYVFTSKADWAQGKLEMQRSWYTWMLWGRLGYNPDLENDFFRDVMRYKYPEIESDSLFTAWTEASKAMPMATEVVQGTLKADWSWYPEASRSLKFDFVTIDKIAASEPPPGSTICSIAETVAGNCKEKKSVLEVVDDIELHAENALSIISEWKIDLGSEVGTNVANIKALSYLSLYFTEKIRGATYNLASKNEQAKKAMARAYLYWLKYSDLMDSMYLGQDFQRTKTITSWNDLNENVLDEYLNLGGKLSDIDRFADGIIDK
ncbi:MAG: hypothetical protein WA913_17185 [Pricia sp.]